MNLQHPLLSATACLFFVGCSAAGQLTDNSANSSTSSASSSAESVQSSNSSAEAFSGENTKINEERSSITFVGGSTIIDHNGEFTEFSADFTVDDAEPANLEAAQLDITIDLTSAVTDSEGLNGHLQRSDFFDTENYPEATFTSTSITQVEGNRYDIAGDLTIKGTTHPVTIDTVITDAAIEGSFDIPRKDYNIGNDSYGDKLLDANVPVEAVFKF